VEWVIINPVNDLPYAGIDVQLFLEYNKNSKLNSDLIFEGTTDKEGRCVFTFKAHEHHNYWYRSKVNLSWLGTEGVNYWIRKQPNISSYSIEKDKSNTLTYEVLPYTEAAWHIKNINCQGINDVMKYRFKELFTSTYGWTHWIQNENTSGCVNEYYPITRKSDKIIVEAEIIREDSTIDYFLDTFFVGTDNIDTIKLYY
jgi:hypothetical protein